MTATAPAGDDAPEHAVLHGLFDRAVAAADPKSCLPVHLPAAPAGRVLVAAVGKAAAAMAAVAADRLGPDVQGLVVTRYGHGLDTPPAAAGIEVIEAGHPMPDAAGQRAAARLLAEVSRLGPDDLLLALISGGGSALLSLPAPGIGLADKQAVTRALMHAGAPISAINCVRKHLSAIKGGRLALAAAPARVVTLAISDVPGDDPAMIASGPTEPDPTTLADARAVFDRYPVAVPDTVAQALADPANETPDAAALAAVERHTVIVADARTALAAAADAAGMQGWEPVVLGDAIEGEARDVARDHAALAQAYAARGGRWALLSGGETTVTVRNPSGRGGSNTEYALALALALDGAPGIRAIACDTDGIDGSGGHAGAVVGPATLARAREHGLDPRASLDANDSAAFFAALGDLVVTGPTRTNVNDFRAILVDAGRVE